MILQDLIIRHKQYSINNDLWKYQPLTFKVQGDGSIELTLYTKTATDNHYLQYSFDGNTWKYAIQEIAPISTADNFKARYKIATIAAGQSIKLRGNVLSSSIHGTFSTKKHGDVFYDVYGNPASLYSSNAFVNIENVDLTELFANYIDEEINKSLYYDDDTLSWKSSGTTKIYEKESSTIKYRRVTSIYQDNVLRSIKNLWLQHSNGIYTKMFIGSQVKTLTDYMPISGNCKGMFYSSKIISNDLSLQLPSTVNNHNYEGMFAYCPNIRNITINIENNDIYAGMFLGSHLEKINITYNNINNGGLFRTIKSMFFECSNINQFNITLNNISVPVFDEYFRFTIPNTLTDCSKSKLSIIDTGIVYDGQYRQINSEPVSELFKNTKIKKSPYIKLTNSSIHCLFKDAKDLEEINTIETDGRQSNLFYDSTNQPTYENIQIINYSKYIKGTYSGNTIDYNYFKLKERKTPLTIYTNAYLVGKIQGGSTDNLYYNTINILQNQSYEEIESLPNNQYNTNSLFSLPYTWSIPNLKISIHVASGNQASAFFFKQGWVGGDYYIHGNYQWTGDGYFSVAIQALDSNPFISILTNEDETTNYINPILTGYFKNTRFPNNKRYYSGEFGYSPIGIVIESKRHYQPISEITVEIKNNNEYELVSRYIPIKFTGTGLSNKFGFKDTIKNITYII